MQARLALRAGRGGRIRGARRRREARARERGPLANDDTYTTPFQTRLRVAAPGYLANDIDIVGKPKLLTKPTHGKLNWHDDGRIDYQPNAGFSGVDYFEYQFTAAGSS